MQQIILKLGGLGLTEPPKEEDWEAHEIHLMDNRLSELPESPNCPLLNALYLQRNASLTAIPPLFFQYMPALQVLNLSNTSIKVLPKSLTMLVRLQKLFLKSCPLLMVISPHVGELGNLEELDLDETQIVELPAEIAKLTKLKCLKVSFYTHVNRSKHFSSKTMIHPGIISNLSHLTNLSIDVNQEDLRWNESVEAVVKEICCLKLVKCLSLYLPEPQLLDKCRLSNRLPIYSVLTHFRLTVGKHKRRYVSRVPNKANAEFSRWDKCLKFVNGHNIPIDVRRALKHTTSFFLDHHITAKNLSEFGIENMKQLKFCLLAECNEMDTIFYGNKNIEDTFDRLSEADIGAKQVPPSLEYLSMYYMGKLETVWKVSIPGDDRLSNLKLLTLHSCPKLTTIFSQGFIKSFVNLEQLILEDCAQVTSLVSTSSTITTDHVLPSLKKLLFLFLPELINISNGFVIAPKLQKVGFYGCPKLKTLSKRELSSTTLKLIRGEAQWWADIEWSNTEWGSRPDYLADLFFPVVDGADLTAEFIEDGDSTEVSRKTECKQQDDESARSNLTNKDKWGAKEINLMDDKVSELPDSPRCPSLNMLYLQKNYELTVIPSLFFEHMPVLKVLDLSYTGIKSLPKSLNKLVLLQKLFLRHCKLMMEIPPQIGELENLDVLDLFGTHIMVLRKEIANLTKLKCLRVSFYGCIHYSKKMIQFEKMIQAGVILNLPELSELCIEVNPADDRWNQAFEVVMKELGCLKKLKSLSLYIPKIEVFNVQCSTSIDYYSLTNFKFTLGAHKLHLVSRVPPEVEAEFGKWHKCLRFVNGKEIPIEVSGILNRASAFFLDHHTTAVSLCSFGLKNMKKLKFCLLVDCNQIDAIINGEEICSERGVYDDYGFEHDSGPSEAPVLGSLLYLNIYYLNNLRRVWKGPVSKGCLSNLKHLSFHMCPQLSVIFSSELINNFVSLEELTLEDCPLVTCLVNLAPSDGTYGYFLPSLKRICLLYLPELISMSSGLCIAPNLERIAFYNCPMLKRISKIELSSKNLKVIKGESKWWKAIRWDGPEWEGQPDYLMQIFSPLSDEKDVMTQLTEDEEILMQNEGWQKQRGLDCVLEKHAINNPNPVQHAPLDTPSVHPITGFTSNLPTEPFNALTSKENQLKKIATMIQEFEDFSDVPLSIHQASSATSPALSPSMGNVHACIEEIQGINVPNSMSSSSRNFPHASRSLFSSLSRSTLLDSDMSNFPKIQISETCPSKVHSSNRESNSGSKRKRMGEEGKNLSDDSSSHGQICPSTSSCISQNIRSLNKMALQQAPSSREAILSNKFPSEKSMDQLRDASRHGFSPENAAPPAKDLQGRNSWSSNSNYHQMPPCMERGEQDDGCIQKTIERCSDGQLDIGYRGSPNYPEPESAFAFLLQASSDQSSGYRDSAESGIYKDEPAAKKLRSGSGKPSVVAFRTKVSGVEVLDDGYKWRKYGQKSSKLGGSRIYYRCSDRGCSVKKRTERDVEDSSYIISTYQGVHNHRCPDKSNHQSQPVTEPNLPTREEAY